MLSTVKTPSESGRAGPRWLLPLLLGCTFATLLVFSNFDRVLDFAGGDENQEYRAEPRGTALEEEMILAQVPEPCSPTITSVADPYLKYQQEALRRIMGFRQEHIDKNQSYAIGLRGVSWVYANLNGTLLAAPELEIELESKKVFGGRFSFVIKDISENSHCDPEKANLISIYARLAGPEVIWTLGKPVKGECKWVFNFEVSVAGSYTILARLLHYNGNQEFGDECSEVKGDDLASLDLELIHEIPRYPYYNTPDDCCLMCARFKECRYSLHSDHIRDEARWGTGTQCILFKPSTTSTSISANDTFKMYANNSYKYKLRRTNPRPQLQNGSIWQLGCGRDEMLLRWAPCGSFGAPPGSRMRGTEDIILFEHEHRDILIDPNLDGSPTVTLMDAQDEMDAPISSKKHKPVCSWKTLRIEDMERGRWTRSPVTRFSKCGDYIPFFGENWATCPQYPIVDDPICMLRLDLANLNDAEKRLGVDGSPRSYLGVWKTELSDRYLSMGPQNNDAHVPGPWVGYFRLHPSSPCRMPPLRKATKIRECLLKSNISEIVLLGDSIIEFLQHHMNVILGAAFPGKNELAFETEKFPPKYILRPADRPDKHGKTAFIANMAVSHILTYQTTETIQRELIQKASDLGKGSDIRIWNTPPFMIWERRQYITAERTLWVRTTAQEILSKQGWREVDYTMLSGAWTLDSTVERDSLHIIGHSFIYMAHLYIDAMCRS